MLKDLEKKLARNSSFKYFQELAKYYEYIYQNINQKLTRVIVLLHIKLHNKQKQPSINFMH